MLKIHLEKVVRGGLWLSRICTVPGSRAWNWHLCGTEKGMLAELASVLAMQILCSQGNLICVLRRRSQSYPSRNWDSTLPTATLSCSAMVLLDSFSDMALLHARLHSCVYWAAGHSVYVRKRRLDTWRNRDTIGPHLFPLLTVGCAFR